MLAVIISCIMVLLFVGVLSYRWLEPVFAARKGRLVDVKVRSSLKKKIPGGGGWVGKEREYYEVMVDFYGLNGEALVSSLRSKTPYAPGDMIRCRYVDKTGFLMAEASDALAKAKNQVLLLLIFFVIFLGFMASALWGMKNGEKKEFHWGSSSMSGESID